jgi:hypothetical protein
MIIRVFRARTKPGHTGAELARMAKEVTIPSSLEGERGLLARYAGTGLGETGEEFTVITVWEDLNTLKTTMAGDDWESPSWSGSRSATGAPVDVLPLLHRSYSLRRPGGWRSCGWRPSRNAGRT